jgi:hypothetical protein
MGKFSEIDLIIKESKKLKNKKYAVLLDDDAHFPSIWEVLENCGNLVLIHDSLFKETKLVNESKIWRLT